LLLGSGQYPLEPDHEKITEQVGVDLLRTPAHVILLKAADALADGGFDLALRLEC
jgi:hypothetical protein